MTRRASPEKSERDRLRDAVLKIGKTLEPLQHLSTRCCPHCREFIPKSGRALVDLEKDLFRCQKCRRDFTNSEWTMAFLSQITHAIYPFVSALAALAAHEAKHEAKQGEGAR